MYVRLVSRHAAHLDGVAHLLVLRLVEPGLKGIAQIELERSDIVRHRLVQNIVNAYERAGGVADQGGVAAATCRMAPSAVARSLASGFAPRVTYRRRSSMQ